MSDGWVCPEPGAVWTCRDGREVPVAEMATSHIRNARALLARNLTPAAVHERLSGAYAAMSMLRGEMAIDAAESEINIMEASLDDLRAWVGIFDDELKEREIVTTGEGSPR